MCETNDRQANPTRAANMQRLQAVVFFMAAASGCTTSVDENVAASQEYISSSGPVLSQLQEDALLYAMEQRANHRSFRPADTSRGSDPCRVCDLFIVRDVAGRFHARRFIQLHNPADLEDRDIDLQYAVLLDPIGSSGSMRGRPEIADEFDFSRSQWPTGRYATDPGNRSPWSESEANPYAWKYTGDVYPVQEGWVPESFDMLPTAVKARMRLRNWRGSSLVETEMDVVLALP